MSNVKIEDLRKWIAEPDPVPTPDSSDTANQIVRTSLQKIHQIAERAFIAGSHFELLKCHDFLLTRKSNLWYSAIARKMLKSREPQAMTEKERAIKLIEESDLNPETKQIVLRSLQNLPDLPTLMDHSS